MKSLFLVTMCGFAVATASIGPARADDQTCKAQSDAKKLAGAAQTSFMKKCTNDATTACNSAAADKKLAGAAKTSFTKKCLSDRVGA
jgi:hypothetical protein